MASVDAVMICLDHVYLRDFDLSPFVTLILTLGRLVMLSLRVPCWVLYCSWFISMNDLHLAIKHSETFNFAEDTHLLHFAKTISSLCSKINADLRILTCWLNANKISLNSSKTEFILFRSRSKPLNFTPFLKLLGKRIYPNSSVKYLGIRIDQHLDWKSYISETSIKLRRANGALS